MAGKDSQQSCASEGDVDFSLAPKVRYCATKGCRQRLAQLQLEPHSLCVSCRGVDCDIGRRCPVCDNWDEATMAEYLAHQVKLKKKRESSIKRQVVSQVAGPASDPPSASEEREQSDVCTMSLERENRLKECLQKDMREFMVRESEKLRKSVVTELKTAIKFLGSRSSSELREAADEADEEGEEVSGDGAGAAPPEQPVDDQGWKEDPRYANAKSLYDCGAISGKAFDNVVCMCKADYGISNVSPNVAGVPGTSGISRKRKLSEGYDSDDNMEPEEVPDFSDLIHCIVKLFPHAKDEEIQDRANDFLYGAAAVVNKREFVRLKLYKELERSKSVINDKVSKLSFGYGKSINVWPRRKAYYKVNAVEETAKINPRLSELCPLKTFSNSLHLSFSLSEALALDRAVAELVQAQSFSFWLMSSFLTYLEHEDFTPSDPSLYDKFTGIISSISQSQGNWILSIQAFLHLLKRKCLLNKLFSTVLTHQKEDLLRSPCFQEYLFDPAVLERVIGEHSKSQHDKSQFQVAKFFSSAASSALSKVSGSSFSGRGARRPFFRPYSGPRNRGNRGREGGKGSLVASRRVASLRKAVISNKQKTHEAITLVQQ